MFKMASTGGAGQFVVDGEELQEYEAEEAHVPDDVGEDMEDSEDEDDAYEVLRDHEEPVYSIAIHPTNSSFVATGGGDDLAYLYNLDADAQADEGGSVSASATQVQATVKDGVKITKLQGHTDSVVGIAFSADGELLATAGYDGKVRVWRAFTGALVRVLEGPDKEIEWIQWHQKGSVLVAGSADATVWMWLATTGDCMQVFAGHEASVSCGTFTATGKILATGSEDGTVRLWDPKTAACKHVFKRTDIPQGEPLPPTICLVRHESAPLLLAGYQDGTAALFHVQNRRQLALYHHSSPNSAPGGTDDMEMGEQGESTSVECVGFAPNLNWCATGSLNGELKIWDMNSHHGRHICQHEGGVVKLVWHPTQPWVITAASDAKLRVWDARTGSCLKIFRGHEDMVLDMDIALGEDESLIVASASDDTTARLFRY